jgi:hypothetical protein
MIYLIVDSTIHYDIIQYVARRKVASDRTKRVRKGRKDKKTQLSPFTENLLENMGKTRLRDLGIVGLLSLLWFTNLTNTKLLSFCHAIINNDITIQQLLRDTKANTDAIENLRSKGQ